MADDLPEKPEEHPPQTPDRLPGRRPSNGQAPNPMALFGVGMEMGLTVLVLALAGWWLDQKLGTQPWLLIIGVLMGTIGGIYNLWNQGRRHFKNQPPRKH